MTDQNLIIPWDTFCSMRKMSETNQTMKDLLEQALMVYHLAGSPELYTELDDENDLKNLMGSDY